MLAVSLVMRFPEGARIAGGRWTIIETLCGGPDRGMYRAVGDGPALVTLGAPQRLPHAELSVRFGHAVDGVAPLAGIAAVTLDGVDYDALIECEPRGEPVTRRRPADPRAVGRGLAAIVARAHAAGDVLGGIRPELVYAEAGRCTGLAPRAEPFLAGASERCDDLAPCFEQVYLSPEALVLRPVTAASDVFSLCATLAYLFDSEPPFPGDTVIERLRAAVRAEHRELDLPPAICAGLSADPARRPTAAAVAAALGAPSV
jgi:hypothetical protein